MDKEKLKEILEAFWFDNQYLKEKSQELEIIKKQTNLTVERYNELQRQNIDTNILDKQLNEIVTAHIDEEQRLINLMKKRQFIEDLIQLLSQPYRTLFYFKYILFFTFDEVAYKMNYSTKRIYQLHNEGLDNLLKIFECSECNY